MYFIDTVTRLKWLWYLTARIVGEELERVVDILNTSRIIDSFKHLDSLNVENSLKQIDSIEQPSRLILNPCSAGKVAA